MAKTIVGTIRGKMRIASTNWRVRDDRRERPSAASTPATVPSTAVAAATCTDRSKADHHSGLSKKRRYWTRLGLVGINSRMPDELNDIGITASTGAIRKNRTPPPTSASKIRPSLRCRRGLLGLGFV